MPPSIDTGETEKKVVSTAEELPVNAPPLNLNEIVTEKDSKASDQGKKDSNQIQSETAPSLAEAQTEKDEVQIIDVGTLIKEENGVEKQDGKKQKEKSAQEKVESEVIIEEVKVDVNVKEEERPSAEEKE